MDTKSELRPLVTLPRPPQALYDRFGHLPIDGTIQLLWEGYLKVKRQGLPTILLKTAFIVQEKGTFSPKLHQKDFLKNHDLLFYASVTTAGNKTFSIFHELLDPSTMEQLSLIESKLVHIDPDTRRPSQLPTVFVEECSKFPSRNRAIITETQKEIVPPKSAFETLIRTRFSDMDTNMHVNFSKYYEFCANSTSEASQSGYFRYYDDDICQFPVLETDVIFKGESAPCSNLDVYTWQDEINVQKMYCAIYLKSALIFQAHFLYGYEKSDLGNILKR